MHICWHKEFVLLEKLRVTYMYISTDTVTSVLTGEGVPCQGGQDWAAKGEMWRNCWDSSGLFKLAYLIIVWVFVHAVFQWVLLLEIQREEHELQKSLTDQRMMFQQTMETTRIELEALATKVRWCFAYITCVTHSTWITSFNVCPLGLAIKNEEKCSWKSHTEQNNGEGMLCNIKYNCMYANAKFRLVCNIVFSCCILPCLLLLQLYPYWVMSCVKFYLNNCNTVWFNRKLSFIL